ncbi:MAG: site-2 protease family protein [Saprospiraceae bacterium]|nr:site-2 protease family protein [Saprospiraceae bacterium]
MKNALFLGSVAGIRIYIHWTFLILIGWIVFSNLRTGANTQEVLWSVLFVLTIFACVTLHELGHALTAKRYHIKTRDITLLPIGGVANMESIPENPKEELLVALAGPAVNVVIFGILYLAIGHTITEESFLQLKTIGPDNFLFAVMFVNLWLAIFNLIPAFPMDGGRVFRALLAFRMDRARATRIAAGLGQVLAMGFVFLGLFYNPFLVFIGVFVFLGAQAEANQTQTHALLHGHTVRDALWESSPEIESAATIRMAADRLLEGQNKYFLVVHDGKPEGSIGRDEIIRALRDLGETASVREAMRKDLLYLSPEMPIEAALRQMQTQNQEFALVSSNDQIVGALDMENIAEYVMIRGALQGKKGQ